MEGFNRIYDVLHHIDLENKEVITKEKGERDLEEYIHTLIKDVLSAPENRHFEFQSETTEVRTLIEKFYSEKENTKAFAKRTRSIAERLLREELVAQERYKQITEIKKGSLIQSFIEYDGYSYILISKVEHESFLNTEDLVKQIGIPYDKKTLKTCIIKLDEDVVSDIIVTDTNNKISTYWVKDFLELKELNSNEQNTRTVFNMIDHTLTRAVKKTSPADFTMLRNNLIGYFRTQESFSYEQMVSNVFGNYKPENPEVDMEKLKGTINKFPEQKKFDTRFTIVDKAINARIRKVVKLSDKIELKINDHIEELKDVIKAKIKPNGEKILEIKTENEEAFNLFKY